MNSENKMKATISWMYKRPHNQLPYVEIIEGEEEIVNSITRLQAFTDDVYVLVEFDGILYDVSDPSGPNTAKFFKAMIKSQYNIDFQY